jgi:hypothetical protein
MTSDVAALYARLAGERDSFRRNSLLRAMCDAQDDAAAVQFVRELDGSAVRRALNRGYYLRLHGAVRGLITEPLLDTQQATDWSVVRRNFLKQIRQSTPRAETRPLRNALDLYAFFDFCVTRAEQTHGQDAVLLAGLADATWRARAIPVEIAERLLSLAAICATQT